MDAIPFIIERLSETPFKELLSMNSPECLNKLDFVVKELVKVQRYMRWSEFKQKPEVQKQALIKGLRLTVRKVGKFMSDIHEQYAANRFLYQTDDTHKAIDKLLKEWGDILNIIASIVYCCYILKENKAEKELTLEEVYGENFEELERIVKKSEQPVATLTSLDNREKIQLFLVKAFPVLTENSEPSKKKTILLELSKELDNLPQLICNACHGLPLALVLVGSLLSFKEMINDIWKKVKDELDVFNSDDKILLNLNIMNYCYEDLPYFLKPCFLYLASYPKGYKIPIRSLINIWVAEGFISTEKKDETVEETAYKYLEQLVKRSLVDVSKRSLFGTIKYCNVNPDIHNFAIEKSDQEGFLVANPDEGMIESLFRVAIHKDNKCNYGELEINHMHSFLAIKFHANILRNARFLRVLELFGSKVPQAALSKMSYLRYLGLRGTSIETLPENIDVMQNLQTLDARKTNIKNLPKFFWKIIALRHVYVASPVSTEIEGPPSNANITDLQTLKSVVVPKSWIDECPKFLISLRKLALSNTYGLDWESVCNLLSQTVNLLSLTIIGESVPSELADTRAFPNLDTVKSIRLEGKWSCRNLFIDNVKFPTNLTKLTLKKCGLKEDPMPRLEMLETLKFLKLQDGAYIGNQMACSAMGFPRLQSLELSKLQNLEKLVVDTMAMLEIKTFLVIGCNKLNNITYPERVTILWS